ncbi:MAG: YicC family protein [Calditrichaeota bacterium]|nr:YicC family protein [Candidatus Cloacimonadota bacterium]MCB1045790.1 YicC family protein [Calditrichota bacterium]
MTGFGRAAGANEQYDVHAELSSLNNRYLDINLKVPRALLFYQHPLRDLLKKSIQRGKINLFLSVRKSSEGSGDFELDLNLARDVHKSSRQLADELGIPFDLGIKDLLSVDGIISGAEDSGENEALWALTQKVLQDVLAEFHASRAREGAALKHDLLTRLELIGSLLEQVEVAWKGCRDNRGTQLRERLKKLISEESLKAERFEMEVAMLLDRQDISEELTRFTSHISFFREAVNVGGPVGSKLNFILQEMLREANTISSKSPDTGMTHTVVEIKEEIERIREQVQNIE